MSDTSHDMPPAGEARPEVTAPVGPTPGEMVKKRREEMGLSHGRVAGALHMTAHYVKALEDDEYDKLPGKTFVKGYFKAYAKLLGMDIDEVMSCYNRYVDSLEENSETEAEEERAQQAYDQNMRWTVCAAVIIVVVLGVSWWMARDEDGGAGTIANTDQDGPAGIIPADEAPVAGTAQEQEPVTAEALVANLEEPGPEQAASPGESEETAGTGVAEQVATEAAPADRNTAPAAVAEVVEQAPAGQEEPAVSPAPASTGENPAAATDIARAPEGDTELVTGTELPDYTVTRIDNHRRVELQSEGSDLLEIHFSGQSWIEVDDADDTRLYHDMLYMGDDLMITGKAPFNILFGDATMVDVTFNSEKVDITPRIRTDNTARIRLNPETR